jgi:hypothetical protein
LQEAVAGVEGQSKRWYAKMDPYAARAITDMERKSDEVQKLLAANPNLLVPIGATKGQEMPAVDVGALVKGLPIGAKLKVPDIQKTTVLDNMFSGQDVADRRDNLTALKQSVASRYAQLIAEAHSGWNRTTDEHEGNVINMGQNRRIPDNSNHYDNQTYPGKFTDQQALNKWKDDPTYFTTITNPDDRTFFERAHPGEFYRWHDDAKKEWQLIQAPPQ